MPAPGSDMTMLSKHGVYWFLPGAFILCLILMYFSGVPALQALVAPESNRELGLLEHVQLVLLNAVVIAAITALRLKPTTPHLIALSLIAAAAAFLAFEEVDYGIHYWELITGRKANVSVRNIHNQGDNTDRLKLIAYLGIVVVCVALPLLRPRIRIAWVRDLIPSRWIISTAALLVVTPRIAHWLASQSGDGSLTGNISEFEEIIVYYLLVLYVWELRQRSQALNGTSET
jgi:hypothetical protein